jgi:hypothetical protein
MAEQKLGGALLASKQGDQFGPNDSQLQIIGQVSQREKQINHLIRTRTEKVVRLQR